MKLRWDWAPRLSEVNETIEIHPASENDLGEVFSMLCALAQYEQLEHEMLATEAQLHELLFGNQAVMHAWLAFRNHQSVGLATAYYNVSTFRGAKGLFIEDLFVVESCRRQGIGKALFACLIAFARGQDCSFVDWAALSWNSPALTFYQRLGGVIRKDWRLIRLNLNTPDCAHKIS